MTCKSGNLLQNSDFRRGLSPWRGTGIKVIKNPIIPKDYALLMNARTKDALVFQKRHFSPKISCAYYLYFRVFHAPKKRRNADFWAVVTYSDNRGRPIKTTPLLLKIPPSTSNRFQDYFVIVPPPPAKTRTIMAIFVLKNGLLLLDTIRLLVRPVGSRR